MIIIIMMIIISITIIIITIIMIIIVIIIIIILGAWPRSRASRREPRLAPGRPRSAPSRRPYSLRFRHIAHVSCMID